MKTVQRFDIEYIQDRACDRIYEIFDAMGIEYTERRDYLQAACPVHGGDNDRGMFWAMRSSHWQCKTRYCHKEPITGPSNSIFGLVRGAMSRKTGSEWSFPKAVSFVAEVLGLTNVHEDDTSSQDMEISKAIKHYRRRKPTATTGGTPLSEVIRHLRADQVYYPRRGVSQEIIDKYYISMCTAKGKPMYQRAFFPILDATGRYVVGWSGRSIHDQCSQCKLYHPLDHTTCPGKHHSGMYTKWRHSQGLKKDACLYNLCHSKPFISRTGTAIVCEGPGDVWAYEAAGIRNSVSILGLSMSRQQRLMLQNAGALTIVFTFDNDTAGIKAMTKLEQDLMHYFRVFCIKPDDEHDIGEMLPADIAAKMSPLLERVSREGMLSDGYMTGGENL